MARSGPSPRSEAGLIRLDQDDLSYELGQVFRFGGGHERTKLVKRITADVQFAARRLSKNASIAALSSGPD